MMATPATNPAAAVANATPNTARPTDPARRPAPSANTAAPNNASATAVAYASGATNDSSVIVPTIIPIAAASQIKPTARCSGLIYDNAAIAAAITSIAADNATIAAAVAPPIPLEANDNAARTPVTAIIEPTIVPIGILDITANEAANPTIANANEANPRQIGRRS